MDSSSKEKGEIGLEDIRKHESLLKVDRSFRLDLKKEKETVQIEVEDKEKSLPDTGDAVHEKQETVLAEGPNMKKIVIKMNERRNEKKKVVPERSTEKG